MGRSVVVTGASSGIGLSTVLELAAHGYDVIGTVRSPEKAEAVTAAALERGVGVRTVLLRDVADAAATEAAFAEVASMTGGGPWAVVNNAGFAQPGAVEDVDEDAARYQLDVNVFAPVRIARLVLPAMRERGDGRIVMMSSVSGRVTVPLLGWYSASKHALEAISDALRAEVAGFGVRVIIIEPGRFESGIWGSGAALVPDVSEPYRPAYNRGYETTAARRMPDSVWVARVVRLSLSNPVPMARYVVGADAMAGIALDALVPTSIVDYVKGVAARLRPNPFW
jgi:NAD(P)-dependent dehydrogenase (short-subunit alcohol dehydrogenase family)